MADNDNDRWATQDISPIRVGRVLRWPTAPVLQALGLWPGKTGETGLRDAAYEARGDLDEAATVAVDPVDLPQVFRVQLDGRVAAGLRELAIERGCTTSDLLNEAAGRLLGL